MTFKHSLLASLRSLAMLMAVLIAGAAMAAASEFVVYHFPDALSSSAECRPIGNLAADSAGNLYGSAGCGTGQAGVIFELARPVAPATAWTESVLYDFSSQMDGAYTPQAGLIFDAAGNLYGTAYQGGSAGAGAVFELSPPASEDGNWTLSVLHNFTGSSTDGALPVSSLVFDSAGNLYGTTTEGGTTDGSACRAGCGTVFELSPPTTSGGNWTEAAIHLFSYVQGGFPRSGVILDAKGNLYGTTSGGGKYGDGVVYRMTPPASAGGAWAFKILHAFSGQALATNDGISPYGSLALRGQGVLYGTTTSDGLNRAGTVFQLVPPEIAGGEWTENLLYTFGGGGGVDGVDPLANVIFDSAGNLYSTTEVGGDYVACDEGCGTVFELSPPASGTTWTLTVLHAFSSGKDGANPYGGVIVGGKGILFGTTLSGGGNSEGDGEGTVYGVVR